ncbi:MAG: choice-of-anchor E domain-containing protein [Planctomycetota bacterium]
MLQTNWTQSVSLPKFDTSKGVLTKIWWKFDGRLRGSAQVESQDVSATTAIVSFQSRMELRRPDGTVLVVTIPKQDFQDSLSAYDGIFDFAGASGESHMNLNAQRAEEAVSPPSDYALFSGPPGNPGTITLPALAIGSSSASGSGNLISQFQSQGAASVTVCYTFAPDCNFNNQPDSTDIAGGSPDFDANGVPDECEPRVDEFCNGDGSQNGGLDCPCMNNAPPGARRGCSNGFGGGAQLSATGVPSVSNDTLVLSASNIPTSAVAWFYEGSAALNGGHGLPFGNGIKCLGGNVIQPQKIHVGTGGATMPEFSGFTLSQLLGAAPGDTRFYQVWYRNNHGPCGGNVNTTNGLKVIWGL